MVLCAVVVCTEEGTLRVQLCKWCGLRGCRYHGGVRDGAQVGAGGAVGAGNNVIDLKALDVATAAYTTVLRRAKPEDLVTKSVGYDIPEDGFTDCDAVEAVFAQIYPVEEERRFFQLYDGYCLLGNNPAKGFLCLTDRRKGDNGKSTAVNLLRAALGADCVIDNKQNLLYEARYSTNVNAHDSGMLAFEGKRLAIMEELSATKTLDTSVMKQLTGGEAHISVRPAGAADTRSMLWSAKLITVRAISTPMVKLELQLELSRQISLGYTTWQLHAMATLHGTSRIMRTGKEAARPACRPMLKL